LQRYSIFFNPQIQSENKLIIYLTNQNQMNIKFAILIYLMPD